jgi:predicted aldo/keto reductase-like oxidoreductase
MPASRNPSVLTFGQPMSFAGIDEGRPRLNRQMLEASMSQLSRRNFIKAGAVAGAVATGTLPLHAATEAATKWVTLGKSKMKVTRLAFGTGTRGGAVQQALGQEDFTRLVRYAYDRGIRFFETAESYGDSQQMLSAALKGLPRESYRLMSKVTTEDSGKPAERLNDLLRNSGTEYFDIMLLHVQHTHTWPEDTKKWQDAILEAQQKKTILARGASIHGLPALRRVPDNQWLEIAMIRMNQKGVIMDAESPFAHGPGNVTDVVDHVQQARRNNMGVISMKLVGEGRFTSREDRQNSMRFAFRHAGVDAVTVGYKSKAEVDEAIENINLAFA